MRHKAVIQNKNSRGYTLTEMMIVVVVMAIAIGLAAPPLQSFIKNNRLTTEANHIVSRIAYARSEAVARRENITITENDDGWVVKDSDGIHLLEFTSEKGIQVHATGLPDTGIVFTPDGFRDRSGNSTITFNLCSDGTDHNRTVIINAAGTTSVIKGIEGCPADE